jgi:hypothetical protein
MIKIFIDWKGQKGFDGLIRYMKNNLIYAESQEQIRILGHHAADNMRQTIEAERKNPARPDHKLENAITAETLNTTAGVEVGIGRISVLKVEAPHWEMINDGGQYVTRETHIVPTTYFADPGSGFVTFKEGSVHVINGIDYVGKAVKNLDNELRDMMEKLGEQFTSGAEKASSGGSTYVSAWGKNVRFGAPGTGGGMGQAR